MWNCGEDITDIEVKPDGSWRVKTKTEADRRDVGELAQWHYPDGSLCEPIGGDVKTKLEMDKQPRHQQFDHSCKQQQVPSIYHYHHLNH